MDGEWRTEDGERKKAGRDLWSPLLAATLLGLIFCSAGCFGLGYQIGAKSLFGQDIKTVYVPIFESDVEQRDLAERLTEAVCKRIEARSPYKVIGRPTADSVLEGRIKQQTQAITIINNYDDPRQKTRGLSVELRWKDRRDRDLRQFDSLAWHHGVADVSSTAYMVAEYGQSEATTDQQQIDVIADKIVGMMETPW